MDVGEIIEARYGTFGMSIKNFFPDLRDGVHLVGSS